jgi:Fur family ferric uptake transcriptional regulator
MLKSSSSTEDIAAVQELLRSAGLRSTTARIAVLQRLRNAKTPLSHAELADELTPLGLDKATVFRNLTDLTDAGLQRDYTVLGANPSLHRQLRKIVARTGGL